MCNGFHIEQFIRGQVTGGRYASASYVVRDGLRLLEREDQRFDASLAALRFDLEQGLSSCPCITAEVVFQRLERRHNSQASEPPQC